MSNLPFKVLTIIFFFFSVSPAFARVTPQDILNQQREAYDKQVASYSQQDRAKLERLSAEIARVNKQRTDQLETNMLTQAAILDEFQSRSGGEPTSAIEKSRYWITFAHEAVAYQAAKIYIFDLNGEKNIRSDAGNLISKFESELNYARSQVVYSQQILKETIK